MSDGATESGRDNVHGSLSDSEKLVRSLVEQGLVGVYTIQDGVFSYVNERFAELFGYSRDEIEGRLGPLDLAADKDRDTVRRHVRRRLRGEADSVRYEFSGKRKDGDTIRIEVHGTRIELAIQDLSEEASAREELLHARATAQRAAGLTRQLLSFGRKRVHSPRPIYLNRVLENLATMLDRLTGAGIQIVFDLAPGLPAVLADPSHVQQVVVNLVINARDAMPDGGRIFVRTSMERGSTPGAASRDPDEGESGFFVALTVRDEGHGMDEETLQHIFDPYFTTKQEGTGLGLSTVYGIVKQHDGEVRAQSEPNRGTDVTVLLPATRRTPERADDPGRSATGADADEPGPGKRTILVVEDEAAVRRVTTAALRRFGYTVLDAEDGEVALELLEGRTDALDLLITDMGLPKMTGPDVARAVEARWPGVSVLFMFGHASDDLIGQLDDRAHVRFLEKPFMVDELLEAVERALRVSSRESDRPDVDAG